MKVINEWDGAAAQTPTQGESTMPESIIDTVRRLRNEEHMQIAEYAQSLCAAGPWRTDVENAEFVDGDEYLIEYTHPWRAAGITSNIRGALFYVAEHDHFAHQCHGIITRDRLRAFATINQPETTT